MVAAHIADIKTARHEGVDRLVGIWRVGYDRGLLTALVGAVENQIAM
ncbi:MAG: hypothetical protein FD139_3604 [Methylocystaceae bacterium]|nr:MAG: hypothetical protein FD172_3502 [Methylocystaceae bacterium]TXT42432.1 MAG: hypothetical protein FD139_3604 [Methylocystaceae bacterium]